MAQLENSIKDFDRKIQLAQGWTSMDISIREQIKGLVSTNEEFFLQLNLIPSFYIS